MSDDSKPIIEFIEAVGDLFLHQDFLIIKPKGIGGFLTRGLQGEKRIPLRAINAVQLKEAGMTTGYLQFTITGGNESRAGAIDAVYDENSFVFGGFMDGKNDEKNKKAKEIRDYIENFNRSDSPTNKEQPSMAAQIKELKDLHEAGVLTAEEFAAAKAKLLA